jgi:menaquinone-specific isochorismate synthase
MHAHCSDSTVTISELTPIIKALSDQKKDFALRFFLAGLDEEQFLAAARGIARAYFRLRDRDMRVIGLGAADSLIIKDLVNGQQPLEDKIARLLPGQFLLGGQRFDEEVVPAPEWQNFHCGFFFLPMLQAVYEAGRWTLLINYCVNVPFALWQDHVLSILARHDQVLELFSLALPEHETLSSNKDSYFSAIKSAQRDLAHRPGAQKLVLARRRSLYFNERLEADKLFFRLKKASDRVFLFFLDNGRGQEFFGASPELLFRRNALLLETESLAGSRPRAPDKMADEKLCRELKESEKEISEHAFVSDFIEQCIALLNTSNYEKSDLEIVTLSYVQHLRRKHKAQLKNPLCDTDILHILHPSPALCGLERSWAKDFIRRHEAFDRGFYTGPIGIFSKDFSELAAAIRSALCNGRELHIYAASGIVPASQAASEWEELNNKEKCILNIFKE